MFFTSPKSTFMGYISNNAIFSVNIHGISKHESMTFVCNPKNEIKAANQV